MKTDNSFFEEKKLLRQEVIDLLAKDEIRVLELYAGKSLMWNDLKKANPHKKIMVFSIEKEKGKNPKALTGDNLKFLKNINLEKFDIIDVDAYGYPFTQLEIIESRGFKGFVVVTAIQTMFGSVPKKMLKYSGISEEMIKKIPSIFFQNGFAYLKNFLYICGIKQVTGFFISRKNYFYYKH